MKLPAGFLILSLCTWGCGGTEVPASLHEALESSSAQDAALVESELQSSAFQPQEAILITLHGDPLFAALLLTDTPGACRRFQENRQARWEKGLFFELGKADGYTEDPFEANALPLDAGLYKVVPHDDTSAGPFQDRWSIVFTTERDGECRNLSTLGPERIGGIFLSSLDMGASGGARGGYTVAFGPRPVRTRIGTFNATLCDIRIEDIPPVPTCE